MSIEYYKLPALPYAYDALEPYIDAKTMELHYEKHHQGYVDKLNETVEKFPELSQKDLRTLLQNIDKIPPQAMNSIRNQGGGHFNHSLFWKWMKKNGDLEPKGELKEAIEKSFGSFASFQKKMSNFAKDCFGSGWTWLIFDKTGSLSIMNTQNQNNPVSEECVPILGIDVWEHAYYLKYQNKRIDYITAWWQVIDWSSVDELYRQYR